jgi:hypothetical protein
MIFKNWNIMSYLRRLDSIFNKRGVLSNGRNLSGNAPIIEHETGWLSQSVGSQQSTVTFVGNDIVANRPSKPLSTNPVNTNNPLYSTKDDKILYDPMRDSPEAKLKPGYWDEVHRRQDSQISQEQRDWIQQTAWSGAIDHGLTTQDEIKFHSDMHDRDVFAQKIFAEESKMEKIIPYELEQIEKHDHLNIGNLYGAFGKQILDSIEDAVNGDYYQGLKNYAKKHPKDFWDWMFAQQWVSKEYKDALISLQGAEGTDLVNRLEKGAFGGIVHGVEAANNLVNTAGNVALDASKIIDDISKNLMDKLGGLGGIFNNLGLYAAGAGIVILAIVLR